MINKTTLSLLVAAALSWAIMGCSGSNQSGNNVVAGDSVSASALLEGSKQEVDSTASFLSWKGFKPAGEHFGKLPVSKGEVSLRDGKLFGGYVSIAMNNIIVEDLEGEIAAQLKGHLESDDFFAVQTYPTARFELTNIPNEGIDVLKLTELQGNLTLKDVTKNITIPINKVDNLDGATKITSAIFTINRADWNVKYGSRSFFSNLGDKFINDDIELSFVLVIR